MISLARISGALLLSLVVGLAHGAEKPLPAGSQTDFSNARWYQVDVLIFTHESKTEVNPESWPTYPLIEFPETYLALNLPGAESETKSDEIKLTDLLDEEDAGNQPSNKPQIAPGSKSTFPTNYPTPFEPLLEEERTLNDYAERINRDRRFRVLFHQAWNHPVLSKDTTIPLYLEGGDDFGNIKELAGFLKIHVSRFLHVEPNLFFTEVKTSDSPFSLLTGDENLTFQDEQESLEQLEPFGGLDLFTQDSGGAISAVDPLSNSGAKEYYVATSSAQMHMSRRMRSKELHYLDNPKFGMLIYFTPIKLDGE